MKNWLEKQFHMSEYGTNVKTELIAGLTTFVTMAYVLATVPSILAGAGLEQNVMFTAMIFLIILTTCAMALYTNRPFALAPALVAAALRRTQGGPADGALPSGLGTVFQQEGGAGPCRGLPGAWPLRPSSLRPSCRRVLYGKGGAVEGPTSLDDSLSGRLLSS